MISEICVHRRKCIYHNLEMISEICVDRRKCIYQDEVELHLNYFQLKSFIQKIFIVHNIRFATIRCILIMVHKNQKNQT